LTAFQNDLLGKTCRNKGDVLISTRLSTVWCSSNCSGDQNKAMWWVGCVATVGEMSEGNWYINLTGRIHFVYPCIGGRIMFTMGLGEIGM
jgi:hypothetical protein